MVFLAIVHLPNFYRSASEAGYLVALQFDILLWYFAVADIVKFHNTRNRFRYDDAFADSEAVHISGQNAPDFLLGGWQIRPVDINTDGLKYNWHGQRRHDTDIYPRRKMTLMLFGAVAFDFEAHGF
jgi:hypothetical protein